MSFFAGDWAPPACLPPPVYTPRRNMVCMESKRAAFEALRILSAKCWARSEHSGVLNGGREAGCAPALASSGPCEAGVLS